MIRLIAWALSKMARSGSERERVLNFLLEHPRRCFTHMFPAVHTLWLLLVLSFLIATQMLVTLWRDWDSLATKGLTSMDKFWNALSLALSTRTAGMNSLDVSLLSQASTFLMVVLMYFSTTPTVVTMRLSTEGELDITGRVEGVEEEVIKGDSLRGQARRYLSQDITYLIVILFLICVFEQPKFETSDRDTKGIYGEFTFFKVLFEVCSAYGTCGYSLGYHSQAASFSKAWSAPSQFLLVLVMILGRLRGLPDSIDPSVRVAMSTGNTAQRSFVQAA
jgi:Trk-type K+ transport system membrane component